MGDRKPAVRALGEIALRVQDLGGMRKFYEETVGLELMNQSPKSVFFRIADGYAGHTQVLALFDRAGTPGYSGVSSERSTVDHIAFTVSLADFGAEKQRLEQLGLRVETAEHAWVHWRSLYVKDPEGNELEWVCYDASV
jgi:catechol-2,3-dioxygenase